MSHNTFSKIQVWPSKHHDGCTGQSKYKSFVMHYSHFSFLLLTSGFTGINVYGRRDAVIRTAAVTDSPNVAHPMIGIRLFGEKTFYGTCVT